MSSGSDGPRSSKRTRVDEEDGPPVLQRDEDVWLSDGNIVVIASDTVAFRVHKSILSLRSEVFSDLFSLPDANMAETMDGLPVVHVSDSPDDIRRLLLVLCCGKNYYYNRDVLVPVPFAVLASLIRMAHKYAIQDVLDDALSRLKRYYTNDLSLWRDPDARARYVTATAHDAPAAVELARLTNTPLLLPTALLVCVGLAETYSVADDGSGGAAESHVATLSVPERARLVHVKGYLTQACATRALYLVAAVPSAGCASRRACTASKEALLEEFREPGNVYSLRVRHISDGNALTPIAEKLWQDDDWERFCGVCREALAKMDAKGVKALWSTLPALFEVDIDKDVWRNGEAPAGGAS
ncbi:hypothetical protein GSI_04721 [Ganoderma sinense ZZ0214-1]|uniref:BTB domain-containing protein n=1 Tax=Ganoderma sinense ZZ0214-1 TaxID=1077348 RepID=A0A2G8SHP8_9APHY|nr:hypothetical protein GSI_04721 [Ganoderma sinense ZZ0214-1]